MARMRTFIAVELPAVIRDACVGLQKTLTRAAPDVKWVEEENLHITLLFLGEVDDRDLITVCRAAQKACATIEPFSLVITGADCFGEAHRPRTIWVGTGEGTADLVALHAALEEAMIDSSTYRREARQFAPHVTLGRAKGDDPAEDLPQALLRERDWQGGECEVTQVRVLSSELRREGPVYAVVSTVKLGKG
jgi:RNA 2',3'-cyclic 3'-phosphodiesterase